MEIVCNDCGSKFKIAESKLPLGRAVNIKCSKCDATIEVSAKADVSTEPSNARQGNEAKGGGAISYNASEKPFDYLQEGTETALLCEHDLEIRQKIHTVLEKMNYHVVEAASARNALKYMRFHTYDVLVLNEVFEATGADSNHVLQYLSQLPISVRRDMFVILLGDAFRTMDNMSAFNKSVNIVVNLENVEDMEKILKGALGEHRAFYKVLRESLVKIGRE